MSSIVDYEKEEFGRELLGDAILCYQMAARAIPNSKIYGSSAANLHRVARMFLTETDEQRALLRMLEECPL